MPLYLFIDNRTHVMFENRYRIFEDKTLLLEEAHKLGFLKELPVGDVQGSIASYERFTIMTLAMETRVPAPVPEPVVPPVVVAATPPPKKRVRNRKPRPKPVPYAGTPDDLLSVTQYHERHGRDPEFCKCNRRKYDADRGVCPLCKAIQTPSGLKG